jgi:hypothetical protein
MPALIPRRAAATLPLLRRLVVEVSVSSTVGLPLGVGGDHPMAAASASLRGSVL